MSSIANQILPVAPVTNSTADATSAQRLANALSHGQSTVSSTSADFKESLAKVLDQQSSQPSLAPETKKNTTVGTLALDIPAGSAPTQVASSLTAYLQQGIVAGAQAMQAANRAGFGKSTDLSV